ncbi:hypothetical protein HBI56_192340 [Parastagonospora nodorum]|uniref:Uncharacterized protein n=2 Tax=Phaeosphaeria nodorum (strain SN15 / ATCC MYA-4574 / FGSC 10173) TaxID=321614 RepID=A0A7U2NPX4_PHANO|nr:hypothetical protein SNOG_14690 [Parastagonospora nodorum SN15]KAH3908125.1 hypothetical protein HBH56_177990 [Parastagonospora nodorum]EAT77882.1 hypothetical protein SNOG_14690 [Parastagonospora nodorum SN15]KAH3931867.1 hypothetical protein HBH54_091820 [Parastagonospora nodorum]KAH3996226.1 hypothetical protein HBI10_162010 [Parastagonospora nodorum]KAH4019559.1 hypothetical protein HBI13_126370 [Parastagonospora nodorum]
MSATKLIDRTEPVVVPRAHTTVTTKSRLPWFLRVPILVVLNSGIRSVLWTAAMSFLVPELGRISRVPSDEDFWSLYSPAARLAMNTATIGMDWYFDYDFYDVAALTTLTNAPYAYLLATYFGISYLTVLAHVVIEVFAISVPTYLLRSRSAAHRANVPLRNRFLLNSMQVQFSNALLAVGVYIVILWAGLKTNYLNLFLINYFVIPTLESAHLETPVSLLWKILPVGVAAKEFLLNPSIAAQPLSGTATPTEVVFDPATATLDETIKANILPADKRKKTLFQQTVILNAFLFASTVQRCMTIDGTEIKGAAGYSALWVVANTVLSIWYSWVGDTSADYEPL